MMGWLTIMQDTNGWSAEQHAEANEEIAIYKKKLRGLIRDADLYHISPRPDGVRWDGIEYWDPRRKAGVVYAFRGTAPAEKTYSFVLQGLEPAVQYRLSFHDRGLTHTARGKDLMQGGLRVSLDLPNSSELIFIEPAK